MRTAPALLILAAMGCASNSTIGGTAQSNVQVVGNSNTVAKLSMVAVSEPVVTALAASPGGAWSQVAATYAEIGIPLSISLPDVMIAGNQGFNVRRNLSGVGLRNYLSCGDDGTGPNADSYQISMNIATQIQKEGDGSSKAATVMDATATSMTTGTNLIRCATTGELEKRINETIAKHLNLR